VANLPPKLPLNKRKNALGNSLEKNGLGRFLDLILFTPPTSNGLELGLERYWWEHEIPPTLILSNVSQPEI